MQHVVELVEAYAARAGGVQQVVGVLEIMRGVLEVVEGTQHVL
jgi:hypothetical protein